MHNELKHKLMAHMVWMNIRLDEEMHADRTVFQMHADSAVSKVYIFQCNVLVMYNVMHEFSYLESRLF